MRVAIDADSNGLELKQALVRFLEAEKIEVADLAFLQAHSGGDYPDVAYHAGQAGS